MPDRTLNAPVQLDTDSFLANESDILLNYPRNETPSTVEVITAVTFQTPGLCLPVSVKRDLLATVLPNGTPRYIGLFSSMPSSAGVGGTELSGSGYDRVAHSTWSTAVAGHVVRRMNVGAVQFPLLTGDLSARGWGAWDAASGGNLMAFGYIRNAGGQPVIMTFAANDEPRFLPLELVAGIQ